jgi:hypothetical protein
VKRCGSLVIFKPGVTKEQAARALELLREVADFPAESSVPVSVPCERGRRAVRYDKVPFKTEHIVNEYDDKYGSPCFYIP